MYLVDTNVWLELMLGQARSEEVSEFLRQIPSEHLFITDFSFHSIGVILRRLNRLEVLLSFVQDVFIDSSVVLINLEPQDTQNLVAVMNQFNLDFDDAYQYVAAERHNLTLVSFDNDFNRTTRGKRTPAEILS
jgi:predicted nucleic acid-binding protein